MERVSKNKISIIVPIYNCELYLERCIESIVGQTYDNIEVLLIDDGSTDSSGKICDIFAKKDSRIKVYHKKNGGVSSARNFGIEKSTGDWISFVDSDDWVEKDFCYKMIDKLLDSEYNLAICAYKRVYDSKVEFQNLNKFNDCFNSSEFLNNVLNVQTGFGFCHMKIYKRSLIDKIRFNEKLKVGEDALFNSNVSKKVNGIFVNECLYNYYFNSSSLVRKYDINYVNKYNDAVAEMKKYIETIKKDDFLVYNYIVYHLMLIAVNYCFHPNCKKKYASLKNVIKIKIFNESIYKSNYNGLSITRKIMLFSLKHKLYFVSGLICTFRQMQFRKER